MSAREILRHASAADLARSVAAMLATRVAERQSQEDVVHIVLTGGGIGTEILSELAAHPACDAIDWDRVECWWGDERFEPTGSPERNETGARAALLDRVPIPADRVHAVPSPDRAASAEAAAADYAEALEHAAAPGRRVPDFAVVLLGIGPEGHVASIFPESPAAHAADPMVVAVHGSPKPPPTRISLTFPAINSAREVWVLASGIEKAQAIRLACDPAAGPLQVPAAGVHGVERTLFCVDQAAAAELPIDMGRMMA